MAHRHANVAEAYAVLGLDQDASLEAVKSAYKQLALKTHPDKNPGDEDATAQFQKVSQAYNVLVKHLDRSSAPSHTHSHSHYHPFGYEEGDYYDDDDDDDYDYDDDFYDDYEDAFEDMEFYRFLFEELLRGRASRFAHAQYQREHHHHHHHHHHFRRPPSPPESQEQYTARLRKQVEEQEKAAERRAREEANRRANQEMERELERREAQKRQRVKASAKKASAEASRKTAEEKARAQQEQMQTLRSQIFAAARKGDAATVRKGVWEQNVDAAGGEMLKGYDASVKSRPTDTQETLMHIAARNGDLDLVECLGKYSADPEERDCEDMTAFHVALRSGHAKIINYFFENYPPNGGEYEDIYRSPDSKSNLYLALDTKEPEMVWLVLDKNICTEEERDAAWEIVKGKTFKSSISSADKYTEFVNLFGTYGGYSLKRPELKSESSPIPEFANLSMESSHANGFGLPQQNGNRRPRPTVQVDSHRSHTASPVENPQTPMSAASTNSPRGYRGQPNRRGSFRPHQSFQGQQAAPSSPVDQGTYQQDGAPGQQQFSGYRGRGRGRGQYRGRARGRGRGQPPVYSTPA
ncbi:hypothetical protein GSI_13712 [Ganoderma sinense ZZ0214-1]|uniref:J domain-containing protein n=1 Tax=Ganoderma sinense ZZ0214-1 TaxID=1077348 RepID=A0A2G8RR43_9APHY|nr:hypothetical protein GSI_13712 [Ganoderma sinense ZZ0214-1]